MLYLPTCPNDITSGNPGPFNKYNIKASSFKDTTAWALSSFFIAYCFLFFIFIPI